MRGRHDQATGSSIGVKHEDLRCVDVDVAIHFDIGGLRYLDQAALIKSL